MTTTCTMAVERSGRYEPCGNPSVAVIEDLEFGEDFPVCQDHLTPRPGPPPGQLDIFGGEAA